MIAIYEHLSLIRNSHCFWIKSVQMFHHNTEEVSTYCRVIYVFLVRPNVNFSSIISAAAHDLPVETFKRIAMCGC